MNVSEYFKIAARSLGKNKVRVMLTVSGIVVGVFLIFVLLSVGSGTARRSMSMINDLAPNAMAVVHGYFPVEMGGSASITFSPSKMLQQMGDMEEGLPLFGSKFEPEMAYTLQRNLPEGCLVTPLSIDIETVRFGSSSRTVLAFATNENYPDIREQGVAEGSFFSKKDKGRNVCVIGSRLKEKVFGEVDPVGRQMRIGGERFKVLGVLESKGMSFVVDNDDFLLVPYWVGGHLGGNRTDGFLISSPTAQTMRDNKETCSRVLEDLIGDKSFTVLTQEELLAFAGDATHLLDVMSTIVIMVAFLVGGVGIMNIMLVAVSERIREIGIRKALGARRADIMKQFLAESTLLGVAGGALGVGLGFLFVKMVSVIFDYPAYTSASTVVIAIGFSIAVGTLFGVLPAFKAAKLDPVDSIRHQL